MQRRVGAEVGAGCVWASALCGHSARRARRRPPVTPSCPSRRFRSRPRCPGLPALPPAAVVATCSCGSAAASAARRPPPPPAPPPSAPSSRPSLPTPMPAPSSSRRCPRERHRLRRHPRSHRLRLPPLPSSHPPPPASPPPPGRPACLLALRLAKDVAHVVATLAGRAHDQHIVNSCRAPAGSSHHSVL